MKKAVTNIPVTVKLRLGWNDEAREVDLAAAPSPQPAGTPESVDAEG